MMEFKCQYFVRVLLAALAVCLSALPSVSAAPAGSETDQIIVKAKPGRWIAGLHSRAGGRQVKKLTQGDGEIEVVKLRPGLSVEKALEEYRKSDGVDYAEPDYRLRAAVTPNDPLFMDGLLYGLHNTGQNGGRSDADIDAPEGWDVGTNAQNVIVAVIDSGVRYTHEDLAANMWRNPNEIPNNRLDDDGNGYTDDIYGLNAITLTGNPWDDSGHGTHVAGTIAAVGNNGVGLAGVAWRAKIMAVKFLDSTGWGYTSDAVVAVDYARAKGASVINASFSGDYYSTTLLAALNRARSAGIIVVAAAGNDTSNNDNAPTYPANFLLANIVAVAATTRSDGLASYSNFGKRTVHLAAPGSAIVSTSYTADDAYETNSGTSMAAPHVAGAFTLLRAHYPSETYQQLINRVLNGVDPLPVLTNICKSGGRLNLQRAMTGTRAPTNAPAPSITMTRGDVLGQLRLQINGDPGRVYAIQSSTNLVNWTSMPTVTLATNGTAAVTIDAIPDAPVFYRARTP
jgi:subtilisin family serine protease